MVTPRRYDSAARVVDELGKGAEILRQATCAVTGGAQYSRYLLFYTEVDTIIRHVRVWVSSNGTPTAGVVQVIYENATGTGNAGVETVSESHTIRRASGTTPTFTAGQSYVEELSLTEERVPAGNPVMAVVTTAVAGNDVQWGFEVGWMPDIWSTGNSPTTF